MDPYVTSEAEVVPNKSQDVVPEGVRPFVTFGGTTEDFVGTTSTACVNPDRTMVHRKSSHRNLGGYLFKHKKRVGGLQNVTGDYEVFSHGHGKRDAFSLVVLGSGRYKIHLEAGISQLSGQPHTAGSLQLFVNNNRRFDFEGTTVQCYSLEELQPCAKSLCSQCLQVDHSGLGFDRQVFHFSMRFLDSGFVGYGHYEVWSLFFYTPENRISSHLNIVGQEGHRKRNKEQPRQFRGGRRIRGSQRL